MFKIMRGKGFWIIVFVILVLLVIMKFSSSNRQEITVVEKMIQQGYAPLQSGVDNLKEHFFQLRVDLAGGRDLQKRIEELELKNSQLNMENMQIRENKAEVERLRTILAYKEAQQDVYVLEAAAVIARSPNNWYKSITINKGTDSGIATNMPVISPDGLVGKVVGVTANSAQISLITDREMAVGAILQETRSTQGIVEGMGENDSLRMINIPYYSPINNGEKVISSGLSAIYPTGILIGMIQDVKRESNGLVLSATIIPSVDFNKLEEVLVVKQFKQ